jgi:hypothetical protein
MDLATSAAPSSAPFQQTFGASEGNRLRSVSLYPTLLLDLSLDERVKSGMRAYLRAGRPGVRGRASTGSRLSQTAAAGQSELRRKKAELLGSPALKVYRCNKVINRP